MKTEITKKMRVEITQGEISRQVVEEIIKFYKTNRVMNHNQFLKCVELGNKKLKEIIDKDMENEQT